MNTNILFALVWVMLALSLIVVVLGSYMVREIEKEGHFSNRLMFTFGIAPKIIFMAFTGLLGILYITDHLYF